MKLRPPSSLIAFVLLTAAAALPSAGCAPPDQSADVESTSAALNNQVTNSLEIANGLGTDNGLNPHNGLSSIAGLSVLNPLTSLAGLSSTEGLMTYDSGRTLVKYIVKCAGSVGNILTKQDQTGRTYYFAGDVGVAPQWFTTKCDTGCQEKISACLMALTNRDGRHVWVTLTSTSKTLPILASTVDDVEYPHQEGTTFGNLFVSPPQMFTCTGPGASYSEQVSRHCIDDVGCDLYTKVGSCSSVCTQSSLKGADGAPVYAATSCKDPSGHTWTNPITIYVRNKIEAGNFVGGSGVSMTPDYGLAGIDDGDWWQTGDVQFGAVAGTISKVNVMLATLNPGFVLEAHADSLTGPLMGNITTVSSGSIGTATSQPMALDTTGLTGRHSVFFVANGKASASAGTSPNMMGNIPTLEFK